MIQRIPVHDVQQAFSGLSNRLAEFGYSIDVQRFSRLFPWDADDKTKSRVLYRSKGNRTVPSEVLDFVQDESRSLSRITSKTLKGNADSSNIGPDEIKATIQAIKTSKHKRYLDGPAVGIVYLHGLYQRLDDMLYELGYSINKTLFSGESASYEFADATKIGFFPRNPKSDKKKAPLEVLLFTIGELKSLEGLVKGILGKTPTVARLRELDESEKEPIIGAIEGSRQKRYLEGPKVDIDTLLEIVKRYEAGKRLGQRMNMRALSDYISEMLNSEYHIELAPETIRDAFKKNSAANRLPRAVLYILQELTPRERTKLFDARVDITRLTGNQDTASWLQQTSKKYGFRNVTSMYRAYSESTGIPFETLQRGFNCLITVDLRIYKRTKIWEANFRRNKDIGDYPQYRVVSVRDMAALMHQLREYYGTYEKLFMAAEPYVSVGRPALRSYLETKPKVKVASKADYDALLKLKAEKEKH